MNGLVTLLLSFHIAAGCFSLILFWVPIFTTKGNQSHRRIGKLYVKAMWLVVITAIFLCLNNILNGEFLMGSFLAFLVIITAKPLWLGIATLSNKKAISTAFRNQQIIFNVITIVGGVMLLMYGISLGGKGIALYLIIFGCLGMLSIFELITCFKKNEASNEWLNTHLANMCTSAIAAYTAFFAFGVSSIMNEVLTSYWGILPWVAPSIIGTISIRLAVARNNRKAI